MNKSILICALSLAWRLAGAQQDVEVKLILRDGNTISGTTKLGNVSLVTDFGKLEIPVKNVSSIEVGISPDKSASEKILNTIKQLASTTEEMRKSAYESLIKMDVRAIPTINDFIYSPRYEPSSFSDYTAEGALSELTGIYHVEENFSTKDVLSVDGQYTIGGVYEFRKIDLKTEYGSLSIPKEKIKQVDVMYTATSDGSDMVFKLYGSKHISGNVNGGWLKTGIVLKQGQKFNITATGEVVLASLSNAKYKPDGKTVGATTGSDYGLEGDYGYGSYPTYGNVVYKVGESSTEILKAGDKFNGTAKIGGMLCISIYETVFNAANSGSYSVKITLK